ncbi:MAG: deoxyribonuclease IV [Chthonomonadales bacterium]
MPTGGSLVHAITRGAAIGCDAVQIFTASPRQWNAPAPDEEAAHSFRQSRRASGIIHAAAHDSYLINLCAPDGALLERSRQAFVAELRRAEALGLEWVVTHMGAHLGSGEEAALLLLAESLRQVLESTSGMNVGVALETTAGQGTCLGATFDQIARVLDLCGDTGRLGVCLDTCHIFAAGYDIRTEEAYEDTLARFHRLIGLERLRLIHANDAKKPLGSRVDRHEHLGRGQIGLAAFRRLVTDPRLWSIPVLVETPEAETMHEVNVRVLRHLACGKEVPMRIKVLLFGHFSSVYPDGVELDVPAGSTPSDAARELERQDARLAGLARICRVAVNEEYTPSGAELKDGDTLAFIPPMSGG